MLWLPVTTIRRMQRRFSEHPDRVYPRILGGHSHFEATNFGYLSQITAQQKCNTNSRLPQCSRFGHLCSRVYLYPQNRALHPAVERWLHRFDRSEHGRATVAALPAAVFAPAGLSQGATLLLDLAAARWLLLRLRLRLPDNARHCQAFPPLIRLRAGSSEHCVPVYLVASQRCCIVCQKVDLSADLPRRLEAVQRYRELVQTKF